MLKMAISYVDEGGHEMPLLESVDRRYVAGAARSLVQEYLAGASECEDPVLATLLRLEAHQAREVLRVAGIDLECGAGVGEELP